ncbi:MAG: methylated-DNA--[Blautia sp.]|nr:methylated-DNA--[protein]-cysteine S-methyltransferase [Blautia sp.]
MRYCYYDSPVGRLLLSADGGAITGLWIEGQKYYADTLEPDSQETPEDPVLKAACAWLDRYFAGEKPPAKELPLAPKGSAFRQEVWKLLCEIPYGEVLTYGEISRRIARKNHRETMSAQAVGQTVGHNPISILIPCHRVVGSSGSLTGYAAGIEKKIQLLELEGAAMDGLFVPARGTAL